MSERKIYIVTRLPPRPGLFRPRELRETCETYSLAKGWHPRIVRTFELQSGAALFHPDSESVVGQLGAGDVLIVPSFATLADDVTARIEGVRRLIGKGVALHILECGGDVGPILSVLEIAFADAIRREADMEKLRQSHAREIAELQGSNAQFERELVAAIVGRYGLPKAGIDALAGLRAETEKKVAVASDEAAQAKAAQERAKKAAAEAEQRADERVGEWLRTLREKRGLSLKAMGELVGASASTLSRLETSGGGPQLFTVTALLDPGAPLDVTALRKRAAEFFADQQQQETDSAEAPAETPTEIAPVAAAAA